MNIPNIINKTTRRIIRYVMFRRRSFELEGIEFKFTKAQHGFSQVEADTIVKYYESLPLFKGWGEFSDTWDIGIDDLSTMYSRPDKFFLFGIKKSNIVDIKEKPFLKMLANGDNLIASRLAYTLEEIGLGEYYGIKNPKNKIHYNKILSNLDTRVTWNNSGLSSREVWTNRQNILKSSEEE